MITVLQAVILGLVQGFTELFPISSLGHSVVIPSILGWSTNRHDPYFLTFLVATHLATATVLFLFFWRDWLKILRGLGRSFWNREIGPDDVAAKMGWLLVVATIPAGILGLLLQDPLTALFNSARLAAVGLIVNGLVLFAAEKLRRTRNERQTEAQGDAHIAGLSWRSAIGIGAAQASALIPGISRSGSSMAGGLMSGLNNEEAARFSFLLSTPVIAAAALLKMPDLLQPAAAPMRGAIFIGALCAAASAYISVRFLVRYFQTRTLTPFGAYCLVAGVIALGYLLVR